MHYGNVYPVANVFGDPEKERENRSRRGVRPSLPFPPDHIPSILVCQQSSSNIIGSDSRTRLSHNSFPCCQAHLLLSNNSQAQSKSTQSFSTYSKCTKDGTFSLLTYHYTTTAAHCRLHIHISAVLHIFRHD